MFKTLSGIISSDKNFKKLVTDKIIILKSFYTYLLLYMNITAECSVRIRENVF